MLQRSNLRVQIRDILLDDVRELLQIRKKAKKTSVSSDDSEGAGEMGAPAELARETQRTDRDLDRPVVKQRLALGHCTLEQEKRDWVSI